MTNQLFVRWLGLKPYEETFKAMRAFTDTRTDETIDEIWLLEHSPVFTQGQNGNAKHILNPGNIPIVQTDRGGQVTYHGPGQLMIYTLIDVKRKGWHVREFVTKLESIVITLLKQFNIDAAPKREAPGVYVNHKKIASIGLRIRRGAAYHGIAFNVSMNLEPYLRINPCGFSRLEMTHFAAEGGLHDLSQTGKLLINSIKENLGYTNVLSIPQEIHDGK